MVVQQLTWGSSRVGLAILRDITELSRQHELWDQLSMAQAHLGVIRVPNSLREGIELQQSARDTLREHGLAGRDAVAAANLAVWLFTAGEWESCAAVIRQVVEDVDHMDRGSMDMVAVVDSWRTAAGLERLVHEPSAAAGDDLNSEAWHAHRLMLEAQASGDLTGAAVHARESVETMVEDAGLRDDFVNVWPRAVRVAVTAGEHDLAGELVAMVEHAHPGLVSTALRAHLLVLRAVVALHGAAQPGEIEPGAIEPGAIEADLLAGIAALDAYGAVPFRAQAQEDLGSWLVSQGRHADAAPHLDAARVTYQWLGATAWLERMTSPVVSVRS